MRLRQRDSNKRLCATTHSSEEAENFLASLNRQLNGEGRASVRLAFERHLTIVPFDYLFDE